MKTVVRRYGWAILWWALSSLVWAQQPAADQAATRLLKAAARFFEQGQYEFAVDTYREFLEQHGDHSQAGEARFFLAESLLLLKRFDEAVAAYEAYLKHHPEGRLVPWARFRLGEALCLAGQYEAAIGPLREYLQRHPDHRMRPHAERYLGEALLRTGRIEEAEQQLRSTIRRYPKLPVTDHARYALAQLLERRGQREEALQYYLAAAQGNTAVADDALLAAGTLEYEAGRYAHAQKLLEGLLERFPQSSLRWTAQFNLGLSLFHQRRWHEAEAHFRVVAQMAKANKDLALDASYWLARTWAEQGRTDRAVEALTKLAEEAADSPQVAARALYQKARILERAERFNEAYEAYLDVARRFPEDERAERAAEAAVRSAAKGGENERVLALAQWFMERFPTSERGGHVALAAARAALALQQPQQALRWIDRAERARDATVARTARYYRALLLADSGRLEEALQVLDALLADPTTARTVPDAYFLAGRCAYRLKRFEDALKAFAVFLMARPDDALARHARAYRAVCLAELGRTEELMAELDRLQGTPLHASTALAAADALFDQERYEDAAATYGRVLGDDQAAPDDRAYALDGLAWAYYHSGQLQDALAQIERFLQEFPSHELLSDVYLLKGQVLKAQGKAEEAEKVLAELIQRFPDAEGIVDAMLARAELLVELGRLDEAIAVYGDLIRILESADEDQTKVELAEVLDAYGWALWKAGRLDAAIQTYRRLVQEHPESPAAERGKLNLAKLLIEKESSEALQEAAAILETLVQHEDDQAAEAAFHLARVAYRQGDWKAVERWCREYLARAPEGRWRGETLYLLVEALYGQGQTAGVGELIDQALAAAPETAAWRQQLALRKAQWLIAQSKWDEALEWLDPITRDSSSSLAPVAEYYKGRALYGAGRYGEALEAFKRSLAAKDPAMAARGQFMIGETLFAQGRHREAIREFLKVDLVYEIPQWSAAALVEAAKCHERLGQWRAARELYERVLAEFPEEKVVEEARRRLKAIETMSRGANRG